MKKLDKFFQSEMVKISKMLVASLSHKIYLQTEETHLPSTSTDTFFPSPIPILFEGMHM